MPSLLERLHAGRRIQQNAGKAIAMLTAGVGGSANAEESEARREPTTLELFHALFPIIAEYWEYDEDDRHIVMAEGKKPENIDPLVKSWMVECITYNMPLTHDLRILCYREFEARSPRRDRQLDVAEVTLQPPGRPSAGSSPKPPQPNPRAHHAHQQPIPSVENQPRRSSQALERSAYNEAPAGLRKQRPN